MELLITVDNIRDIRAIAESVDDVDRLDPYISEAQQVELKELMGVEFFYHMLMLISDYYNKKKEDPDYISTPEEELYLKLLKGGEYLTAQGHSVRFSGLATVLSYFSYARLLMNDNMKHTNGGFVVKKTEFSDPASANMIIKRHQDARSMALSHWADVTMYLDQKRSDYPLWRMGCKARTNNIKSSARISGVTNRRR
ncbi:hypothetical protein BCY91_14150 [Pelobium manganitolerans]|uniref:Uncharacterized protein n=1 Tax=Pelobium manganitolerans TaxID=1842495 RepID=A0A419SA04_9SPHI|nr:hypothetical protein [Pelobium manganitolerans]RKD19015.1 hypothetical protein BCY91_14150 [Pelobium manganitolerans]